MGLLSLALKQFETLGRDLSAKDLQVRLPVDVANPNKITQALREAGCIVRSFRQKNEQFYALVPGAVAPPDGRVEHINAVNKARAFRGRMKRVRMMRKVRRA